MCQRDFLMQEHTHTGRSGSCGTSCRTTHQFRSAHFPVLMGRVDRIKRGPWTSGEGNETARVHHPGRWPTGVAACDRIERGDRPSLAWDHAVKMKRCRPLVGVAGAKVNELAELYRKWDSTAAILMPQS